MFPLGRACKLISTRTEEGQGSDRNVCVFISFFKIFKLVTIKIELWNILAAIPKYFVDIMSYNNKAVLPQMELV